MVATIIWGKAPQSNTHLTTKVKVQDLCGTKTVEVLINGDANVNIISQILVKESGFKLTQIDFWAVSKLAGHPITTFGTHKIEMTIRDCKSLVQTTSKVMIAATLQVYDMVLSIL